MYQPLNGWTKETIIQAIQTKNKGTPSVTRNGVSCSYFGEGGNRCAVGCFIPDNFVVQVSSWEEECLKHGEGYGAKELFSEFPEMGLPLEPDALENLQSVHDRADKTQDPRPALIKWVEENVA